MSGTFVSIGHGKGMGAVQLTGITVRFLHKKVTGCVMQVCVCVHNCHNCLWTSYARSWHKELWITMMWYNPSVYYWLGSKRLETFPGQSSSCNSKRPFMRVCMSVCILCVCMLLNPIYLPCQWWRRSCWCSLCLSKAIKGGKWCLWLCAVQPRLPSIIILNTTLLLKAEVIIVKIWMRLQWNHIAQITSNSAVATPSFTNAGSCCLIKD